MKNVEKRVNFFRVMNIFRVVDFEMRKYNVCFFLIIPISSHANIVFQKIKQRE